MLDLKTDDGTRADKKSKPGHVAIFVLCMLMRSPSFHRKQGETTCVVWS